MFYCNPFDDNDVYNSLINTGGPKPISIELYLPAINHKDVEHRGMMKLLVHYE